MNVFYLISFFMIGAVLGSFYNVLGIRIVKHESIVMPRSHCDKCGHILKWYELIPIISFILLQGRCRQCKTKLSWLYPFSELFCGIMRYRSCSFKQKLYRIILLFANSYIKQLSERRYILWILFQAFPLTTPK